MKTALRLYDSGHTAELELDLPSAPVPGQEIQHGGRIYLVRAVTWMLGDQAPDGEVTQASVELDVSLVVVGQRGGCL